MRNTCAPLGCKATELCVTTDAGAYCDDNSCTTVVDFPESKYCSANLCTDDACTPGSESCTLQDLYVCKPNGSGTAKKLTCGSGSLCTTPRADPMRRAELGR